ncbi:uncharacterized protein IL334_001159 [Kwoniella shivajii]|uniref:Peroxisomal membrane protein PEX13 n=1 Tax=Kwoniella shivajii TaxID=564305 RepID=A0ABZ1CRI3_9TREE|nr:hypothetical protein IL334_001159 [Kwoniella shivajii]
MTSLPPRPKPWETASSPAIPSSEAGPSKPSTTTTTSSAFDTALQASSSSNAPRIPDRPADLAANNYATQTYPNQSRYTGSYGMSPYSGIGGMGGVGGYGGGYGGYGGGYGGMSRFGGGYGGMGGYGMGGYGVGGMGGPGEGYPTLTSSLQASTAPAFAVLESLVTAFTSLAQLIESTYMATHSSFFAMVGVADQLGSLKTYLGQVLGVFSILRLGKKIIAWLKGKKIKTSSGGWANEWSTKGISKGANNSGGSSGGGGGRPSLKPLVLFLLSAVGLPYLMSRLVKLLIASQQQQQQQQLQQNNFMNADGTIDPTKLEFARAKWEFKPSEEWELALGRDEIVAVLEKRSGQNQNQNQNRAQTNESDGWWRGRTRDGRTGWFPGNYVEVIRKREVPPASSTNTG